MRILGVVVVIVAAVIAAAIFYIDTIAKTGIERGTEYAAGVPTSLDSARIGLVSGRFRLSGLEIGNPPGYKSPHFLALGRAELQVPVTNLLENTVKVPLIELDGIDVYLEKDRGKGNYDAILGNLARLGGSASEAPAGKKEAAEAAPSAKSFVVENLVIRQGLGRLGKLDIDATRGLTEAGGKVLGNVVEGIEGGGKPIGEAAGSVGEKLKEGLGGLGGLLGGSKKEE
jgi:uncharacterized protein involved in outer membrane biogenesis